MTPQNFINVLDTDSPGTGSSLIVPSDTVNFTSTGGDPKVARALYVEGAGTVAFIGADGNLDSWVVGAATTIRVACVRVNATGTSATRIHAIW